MTELALPTGQGLFVARYSARGLVELRFPGDPPEGLDEPTEGVQEWHAFTTAAVWAVLNGHATGLIPPLDLEGHTTFRLKVWEHLQRIPIGETASYAEVAAAIGQPGAMRAVGGACGANPVPLIIPCHRVVQMAGGRKGLGGFSGGLDWKRKLLAVEGVVIEAENRQKQDVLAGFDPYF